MPPDSDGVAGGVAHPLTEFTQTAAAGYRRVFLNGIPNVVRDHPTMRFGIGYAF